MMDHVSPKITKNNRGSFVFQNPKIINPKLDMQSSNEFVDHSYPSSTKAEAIQITGHTTSPSRKIKVPTSRNAQARTKSNLLGTFYKNNKNLAHYQSSGEIEKYLPKQGDGSNTNSRSNSKGRILKKYEQSQSISDYKKTNYDGMSQDTIQQTEGGNENFPTISNAIEKHTSAGKMTEGNQYIPSNVIRPKKSGSNSTGSYPQMSQGKESNGILPQDQSDLIHVANKNYQWDKLTLPVDPKFVFKNFESNLSLYEKREILDYPEIYFISDTHHKLKAKQEIDYDDDKGDYLIVKGDQFRYRYEAVEMLGRGSFGQVIKAFDHKRKEYVALKVIRSQKKFHFQAKIEIKMLRYMMANQGGDYNIVDVRDYFLFRNHVCIVFDMLSVNLYDLLKRGRFKGIHPNILRKFSIQLLYALKFLAHHKIIHCDLKPENILLKNPNKTGIKLIDFGSSCFENEKLYTYIQSRFYRSPEIILGLGYNSQIDMWSFGCFLCELHLGYPIFSGESEHEQILSVMEVLGVPPVSFLMRGNRRNKYFDENLKPKVVPNSKGKVRVPGSTNLNEVFKGADPVFIDLVKNCLQYDPNERFCPDEALAHEWILEGLPKHIQAHHMRLVDQGEKQTKKSEAKDQENMEGYYIAQPKSSSRKTKSGVWTEQSKDIVLNNNNETQEGGRTEHSPPKKDPSYISHHAKSQSKTEIKVSQSQDFMQSAKKKFNFNINGNAAEDSVINITINVNNKDNKKEVRKIENVLLDPNISEESKMNMINNFFQNNNKDLSKSQTQMNSLRKSYQSPGQSANNTINTSGNSRRKFIASTRYQTAKSDLAESVSVERPTEKKEIESQQTLAYNPPSKPKKSNSVERKFANVHRNIYTPKGENPSIQSTKNLNAGTINTTNLLNVKSTQAIIQPTQSADFKSITSYGGGKRRFYFPSVKSPQQQPTQG